MRMERREYNALGSVDISPRAVAIIASVTTGAVPGVAALGATLSETAAKKLGHASPAQGVEIVCHDDAVELTIRLLVTYGWRVPDVALEVQKSVKDAVESLTGYDVLAVHILVQDIVYPAPKEEKP